MTVNLSGRKWYRLLTPGENRVSLLNEVQFKTGNLIVSLTTPNQVKLFTIFNDYIEFDDCQLKFPEEYRSFYEIILGDNPQKPHFDIDADKDYKHDLTEIINKLIDNIIKYIPDLNLQKDVQIFNSHGVNKKSHHIVINNYCHQNHQNAKAFYELVIKDLPEGHGIDRAVYSKTQQFRMVGSQKIKSGRIKKLELEWKYHDKTIIHIPTTVKGINQDLVILSNSLVSMTGNCKMLPEFTPKEEPKTYGDHSNEDFDIDGILDMCKTMDDGILCYSFTDDKDNIVILKREIPSMCKMCKRVHENENPFVTIVGGNVFFNCRRNDKGYYMGKFVKSIDSYVKKEIEEDLKEDLSKSIGEKEVPKSPVQQKVIKSKSSTVQQKVKQVNDSFEPSLKGSQLMEKLGIKKNNKECKGLIASAFMEID